MNELTAQEIALNLCALDINAMVHQEPFDGKFVVIVMNTSLTDQWHFWTESDDSSSHGLFEYIRGQLRDKTVRHACTLPHDPVMLARQIAFMLAAHYCTT